MTTLLYSHAACLDHDPGSYHPESPERLRAVLAALSAEEFAGLDRREAPRAALDDIARVHPRGYIDAVLAAIPASAHAGLDADTIVSPGSGEAALRAAGAVCAAVDAAMTERIGKCGIPAGPTTSAIPTRRPSTGDSIYNAASTKQCPTSAAG